jgi:hypothetical protein
MCMKPSCIRLTTVSLCVLLLSGSLYGLVYGEVHPSNPGGGSDAEICALAHIGGICQQTAVLDHYAYIGIGSSIVTLDMTNQSQPKPVSRTDIPGYVVDLCVGGDLLFVTNGTIYGMDAQDGLYIFSLSNPEVPVEIGLCSTPLLAVGVDVSGGYAYVADEVVGIRIIDISDPGNPVETGQCTASSAPLDVKVEGGIACIATHYAGLDVFDVSNPANPTLQGSYNPGNESFSVALQWPYAFLANGAGGIRVIDVSTTTNPSEVGALDDGSGIWSVTLGSAYLYAADYWDEGVRVIDISNPLNPVLTGICDMPGTPTGAAVMGNVIISGVSSGARIIDVSNPSKPRIVSGYYAPGDAFHLTHYGNALYVTDWDLGFHIVDMLDPAFPICRGYYDSGVPEMNERIDVNGDVACFTMYYYGLRIFDISNPSAPQELGSFSEPNNAEGVKIAGNYVYVADDSFSGLRVIDISNPANPFQAGACVTGTNLVDIEISGNQAYVTCDFDGLRIIDISNPIAPVLVGTLDTIWAYDVAVSGSYAYVAGGPEPLHIVDVSNPTLPFEAASIDTTWAYAVSVSEGLACVAAGDEGLYLLDISVPTSPSIILHSPTYSRTSDVTIQDDIIYLAQTHSGVSVLQYPSQNIPDQMVRLELATDLVHPGDMFWVKGYLENKSGPLRQVPTFFMLEIYGVFYFWPSWATYDPPESTGIDFRFEDVPHGSRIIEVMPEFIWPDTGQASLGGMVFYGAMLTQDMSAILGEMAVEEWGFGP